MEKIPVYLFLGFLEGGKTSFIQKTLANEHFGNDENILLLVCEEGSEEYDFSELKHNNVTLHVIEDKTDLDEHSLLRLSDECEADRIVIELNRMWHMTDFLLNKPDNWLIFQTVFVADSSSFSIYVKNLKSLVIDKINVSDVVIFNRY